MRVLLAVIVLCASHAAPAAAQIFAWRDAQGLLVVSDRPRGDGGEMATYDVPGSRSIRTTRPAAGNRARSADVEAYIDVHAASQGVPADLVRAVIQVESAYNPRAVSPKGAMGLMQLMPATARELGVTNPFHPEDNIRAGVTYLRRLLDRYDNNVELALAAYNAGPASIERYGDIPPYRETRDYVRKVTGATALPPPAPPPTVIYKWVDMVDGRAVVRYSNRPPAGVTATPVGRP